MPGCVMPPFKIFLMFCLLMISTTPVEAKLDENLIAAIVAAAMPLVIGTAVLHQYHIFVFSIGLLFPIMAVTAVLAMICTNFHNRDPEPMEVNIDRVPFDEAPFHEQVMRRRKMKST